MSQELENFISKLKNKILIIWQKILYVEQRWMKTVVTGYPSTMERSITLMCLPVRSHLISIQGIGSQIPIRKKGTDLLLFLDYMIWMHVNLLYNNILFHYHLAYQSFLLFSLRRVRKVAAPKPTKINASIIAKFATGSPDKISNFICPSITTGRF